MVFCRANYKIAELFSYIDRASLFTSRINCPKQAMAQIRTVYSFVGEKKALDSYKEALKVTLKLGYKGGMAKGLGIGSFWMVFLCSWSLVFWYASTLVLKGETNGGKATTTAFNVLYGGTYVLQYSIASNNILENQACACL